MKLDFTSKELKAIVILDQHKFFEYPTDKIKSVCPALTEEESKRLEHFFAGPLYQRLTVLADMIESKDSKPDIVELAKNTFLNHARLFKWDTLLGSEILGNSRIALILIPLLVAKSEYPDSVKDKDTFIDLIATYFATDDLGRPHDLLVQAADECYLSKEDVSILDERIPKFKEATVNAILVCLKKNNKPLYLSTLSSLAEYVSRHGYKWQQAPSLVENLIDDHLKLFYRHNLIDNLKRSFPKLVIEKLIDHLAEEIKYEKNSYAMTELLNQGPSKVVMAILTHPIVANSPPYVLFNALMKNSSYAEAACGNKTGWNLLLATQQEELITKYIAVRKRALQMKIDLSSKFVKTLYEWKNIESENAVVPLLGNYFLHPAITVEIWSDLFNKCSEKFKKDLVTAWCESNKETQIQLLSKFYHCDRISKGATLLKICKKNPFFVTWLLPVLENSTQLYPPYWVSQLKLIVSQLEDQKVADEGQIRKIDFRPLVEAVNGFENSLYESKSGTRLLLSIQSSLFAQEEIEKDQKYLALAPKKKKAAKALDEFGFDAEGKWTGKGMNIVLSYMLDFYHKTKADKRDEFKIRVNKTIQARRFEQLRKNWENLVKFWDSHCSQFESKITMQNPGSQIIEFYQQETYYEEGTPRFPSEPPPHLNGTLYEWSPLQSAPPMSLLSEPTDTPIELPEISDEKVAEGIYEEGTPRVPSQAPLHLNGALYELPPTHFPQPSAPPAYLLTEPIHSIWKKSTNKEISSVDEPPPHCVYNTG